MKRSNILLPGLLIVNLTGSVANSREIVEFSIYDEFGDIMLSGPGELVLNGRRGSFRFEDDVEASTGLENYRYRRDTYESAYQQGQEALTNYRNKRLQKKVWKFRPLEDKKDKKIIKIEDPPAAVLMPRSNVMMSPGYMTPGLYSPTPLTPGMMYPGMSSPSFLYPLLPFRF